MEGAESTVLQGALGILSRGRTSFLLELHRFNSGELQVDPEKVRRLMRSKCYVEVHFFGHSLFVGQSRLAELPIWLRAWSLAWQVLRRIRHLARRVVPRRDSKGR